jgi:hypothetical protein
MAMVRENGKRTKQTRRGRPAGFLLVAGLATLLLTGCPSTTPTKTTSSVDPLLGDYAPRPGGPAPAAPPPGPSKTSQLGVPPIPSAQLTPSAAGLASGRALQGGRPLALDGGVAAIPAAGPAKASLQPLVQPVPRELPLPGPGVVPVGGGAWTPPPTPGAQDALLAQLKARNVLWHKQETVPGGVRFSCIVPSRTQPDATRVFEATGRDLTAAVQAVLQKIDSQP